jgi:hypothetical protein
MKEYLVVLEMKGNKTNTLKKHIIQKRVAADNPDEAVEKAAKGKLFEEEGYEVIFVSPLN